MLASFHHKSHRKSIVVMTACPYHCTRKYYMHRSTTSESVLVVYSRCGLSITKKRMSGIHSPGDYIVSHCGLGFQCIADRSMGSTEEL